MTVWAIDDRTAARRFADATPLVGHPPASSVTLRFAGADGAEHSALERRLNRQLGACGCIEAALAGVVAALMVVAWRWPHAVTLAAVAGVLARAAGALVVVAFSVKLAVIAIARARVRRALRRLGASPLD